MARHRGTPRAPVRVLADAWVGACWVVPLLMGGASMEKGDPMAKVNPIELQKYLKDLDYPA